MTLEGREITLQTESVTNNVELNTLWEAAKAVSRNAAEEGLLLLTCGTFNNVVRWIPPLVVTEAQIEEGLSLFRNALARL